MSRRFKVRQALAEIGVPGTRWFHEVHPIWKRKIVAARQAKDVKTATRLSELFAYLKKNMNRRCNTPGCEATVASHVRDCRMHSTAKRAGTLRAPTRTAIGAVARVVNGKAGRPGGVDRVFEKVRLIDRSATRLSVRRGLSALVAQGSLVRSGHNSRRRRRVGFRFAKAFAAILLSCFLCGCRAPTWSAASPQERQAGAFRADAAYLQSQEYRDSIIESVDTVERLRAE